MPKRRSRKRRAKIAPLMVIALLLLAFVAWAISPHHVRHRRVARSGGVSSRTSSPSSPAVRPPVALATPLAAPPATPLATPPSVLASAVPPAARRPGKNVEVAIIIDDCGQWLDTEEALISLPIPITFAVLPHVRYTSRIAQEAQEGGKGVMLHLPMEPISHANPGPGEITDTMTDEQIAAQTSDDLAQVPLAAGANNHEGSEASADSRVMKDVMAVMKAHNLFFVDSRTSAKTVAQSEAQAAGVPNASRSVFLDNQARVAYTESMLEKTVALARQTGSAIAIGHPKPSTLAAIRALYPRMQAQGVDFVLVQNLVHD